METRIPTIPGFVGRIVLFLFGGTALGMISNMTFYRLTLQATWQDQAVITAHALPLSVTAAFVYLAVMLILSWPILRFLRDLKRGLRPDAAQLMKVEDTCLNLGYKLALLGLLFFALSTPVTLSAGVRALGWPASTVLYGLATGTVAGLLLFPYGMILSLYVIRPILDYTAGQGSALSRQGGRRLSLRVKIILTFIALINAVLIYSSTVGYSQTLSVLENMKRMEREFVAPERQALLADTIEHKLDPRVCSSAFFENRLGDLRAFYLGLIAVAALITFALSWMIAGEITRPLRKIVASAERIAQGRTDLHLAIVTNDELGSLGHALNGMTSAIVGSVKLMEEAVRSIGQGVEKVDQTVKTILAISTEQSTGATQQASAVQQSSSIAEEIVVTARQIADKAKSVDLVATETVDACSEGEGKLGEVQQSFKDIALQVDEIRSSMRELQERFQETYKIVQLMEDMADQTELLALNAALEAAGAGEHGRRFSVVAEATRRLAARSAQSAQEIKALIETIQRATVETTAAAEGGKAKVDAGAADIAEVVQALHKIKDHAAVTSRSVREITVSTNQQSSASEQLAASIGEVREVAARVEEGAKEIETTVTDLRDFSESLRVEAEAKAAKGKEEKPA